MAEWIIRETGKSFLEIKRSKFYSYCLPVSDVSLFHQSIKIIKLLHPEATHAIYAYRILENGKILTEKCSDDKEPPRTAGFPSLVLLRQHELINTAIITLRVFGGVKLGKNNLLRTYLEAAQLAIHDTHRILLERNHLIKIILNEQHYSLVMKKIKHSVIAEYKTEYQENAYHVSFSIKESEVPDWRSFFEKHQIYTYAIIEQNI